MNRTERKLAARVTELREQIAALERSYRDAKAPTSSIVPR
jgi:hypothetical protein